MLEPDWDMFEATGIPQLRFVANEFEYDGLMIGLYAAALEIP